MNRFEGKVVLITGAANGLGLGMAEQFIKEGAVVAAVDLEADTLEKVYAGNDKVLQLPCDVTSYDQVQATVAKAVEHFGHIDILMNNAGITHRQNFLECSKEGWQKVMDVNLNGAFYVAQTVAKHMVEKGIKGAIVNTASVGAVKVMTNITPYCPSKAGIAMLTKVMGRELIQYGIRVNAFGPGSSLTRIAEYTHKNPERNAMFLSATPIGRYGEVREAVDVALFLASEQASYLVGQNIIEDGGFSL